MADSAVPERDIRSLGIAHPLWAFLTALSGVNDEFERVRLTATFIPSVVPCQIHGAALLNGTTGTWRLIMHQHGDQLKSAESNDLLVELEPLFEEAFRSPSLVIATSQGRASTYQVPQRCLQLGVRALAIVPLMTLRDRLGTLIVGRDDPVTYSEAEQRALLTLAEHTAIGLENLRLTNALERRSREFERLYHNTPVMMHSINHQGMLISVNDVWLRTLGYERDEVIDKKKSVEFLTPESRQRAVDIDIPMLRDSGMIKDREYQMVKKNGEVIDIVLSAVIERDSQGHMVQSYAFIADVTYRKKAEAALRHSEARYRRLVEHAADAFYLIDAETSRILDVNQRACNDLGYTRDELLNMTVPDVSIGLTREQLSEIYQKCISGVPHSWETTHRRKDGSTFLAEVRVLAFEEAHRKLQVALARDITERKRAEEDLKERTAELEAFSYSISHDLRAPLRAIDGFSQILAADRADELDTEGKRLLSVIRQNTQAMGQMIDDLLAFFRIGRQEMRPTEVDLSDLAHVVAEELRSRHPERTLCFDIQTLPRFRGDSPMMRQVLVNLLSNAVKFTSGRETAVIEVGHAREEGQTVYYVKDNGVGFEMQYVDKIFGVFQRLHAADEFEGTGVGLAIVQRIVQRHGGRVWAAGTPGEGATIYFSIAEEDAA